MGCTAGNREEWRSTHLELSVPALFYIEIHSEIAGAEPFRHLLRCERALQRTLRIPIEPAVCQLGTTRGIARVR